jgi:son of sevenless-like protein
VIEIISRANRLSYWVSSIILWRRAPAARVKVLEKIIGIADELLKLNNYHSLMGIIAGVNTSSVSRLQKTFDLLSPKILQRLKDHQAAMSMSGSYKQYRALLHAATGPCVPYM